VCLAIYLKERFVLKDIFILLSSFLLSLKNQTAISIHNKIANEITLIIYKLMIAVILIFAISLSLYEFTDSIKILLSHLENGIVIKLISFGSISLLGIHILSRTFKYQPPPPEQTRPPTQTQESIDMHGLGVKFIEGMIEGYENSEKRAKDHHQ
jgi:hypothetical protein